MATYLIQVKDNLASGTPKTIFVFDPISFIYANLVVPTTVYELIIFFNSFSVNTTQFTEISGDKGYANAEAALAQLYTDLNAYYNS